MRHQQFLTAPLALLLVCLGSLRVQAADDVVQQIPDSALAYVVVKNVQQTSREITQVAQQMQLPALDLLQMVKEHLKLGKGLVDCGDLALVLVSREAGSPFPVLFLRTSDYGELLGQLNPQEQEGPISQVMVGGETALIGSKGEYAVLAPPMFRDGLKQVVESQKGVSTDDQILAFTEKAEVYAVATESGVQTLSQQALVGLQLVKLQFEQAGPEGASVVAAFGLYEEMFKWASEEVRQVAVTLQVDDDGSLSLMKRVNFRNSSEYNQDSAASATERLAQLPKWPYFMAFAGEMGDSEATEKWMQLSINMMRTMVGPQQLTDEKIEKLIEASRKSIEGLRGMSFTLGVPRAGGSIYSRMGIVMEVEDSRAYIKNYLQAMQQMREIFGDNESMPYRILVAEEAQVADVQGMKVVMQIMPAAFGPGGEQAREMFDKLYGADGKIEVYAAPIDAKRIALAYVSEQSLREVIQAAQSATTEGLATVEGIQATTQLLSKEAQLVGYISPEGALQFVQQVMATLGPPQQQPQIPPFPQSPPLGFSLQYNGKWLDAGLVAPADSLSALGKYIQSVRQAAVR